MSPVRALGSVAVHGPWRPDSPNAWYIAKPAFPPVSADPPPVPRSLGVIVPPLNKPGASVTFVEPKAQTATPLAVTRVAEVSLMLLLAVAVPVVKSPIGFPAGDPVGHMEDIVWVQVPLYMIPTMVAAAGSLNVKFGSNVNIPASVALIAW